MDEVLLVASSRSFGAVNREQFYVSISRGRERVHVFTDDAELLARRVTDSHERKAAVELQALRDDLAKLGFVRRQQLEGKMPAPPAARSGAAGFSHRAPDASAAMRESRACLRCNGSLKSSRTCAAGFDERLGIEQKETVAEKVGKPSRSNRPKRLRPSSRKRPVKSCAGRLNGRRQQQQQQRRSGGMHI